MQAVAGPPQRSARHLPDQLTDLIRHSMIVAMLVQVRDYEPVDEEVSLAAESSRFSTPPTSTMYNQHARRHHRQGFGLVAIEGDNLMGVIDVKRTRIT